MIDRQPVPPKQPGNDHDLVPWNNLICPRTASLPFAQDVPLKRTDSTTPKRRLSTLVTRCLLLLNNVEDSVVVPPGVVPVLEEVRCRLVDCMIFPGGMGRRSLAERAGGGNCTQWINEEDGRRKRSFRIFRSMWEWEARWTASK